MLIRSAILLRFVPTSLPSKFLPRTIDLMRSTRTGCSKTLIEKCMLLQSEHLFIYLFIREDIPSRKLPTIDGFPDFEGLFIEIKLRKSKWLLLATNKPPSFSKDYYFALINKALDAYSSKLKI